MKTLRALILRNSKLFFKDKGMFFTSIITPLILLLLYTTFLGKIYRDSFSLFFPEGMEIPSKLIDGAVGAQLLSSLLSVSCVTVAFCSNMLTVQDKATGVRADLTVSPVKPQTLALGYYVSSFISTVIVCAIATLASLIYIASVGWYMSIGDVLLIFFDILLLVMFGTALSSIINFFLSTQGQISAVGTIVSSGYGFICGAYMPISQFNEGLQRVISFLPGTYATALLRNHAMRGAFAEMEAIGVPAEAINAARDAIDCNLYFLGNKVSVGAMFAVLGISVALLIGAYVLLNVFFAKRAK